MRAQWFKLTQSQVSPWFWRHLSGGEQTEEVNFFFRIGPSSSWHEVFEEKGAKLESGFRLALLRGHRKLAAAKSFGPLKLLQEYEAIEPLKSLS